jgi:glycosyltransferase involved in cell wall biosynthesis
MFEIGKHRSDDMPIVSIGLPVYNGERTIGAAITAILSQSFADFELIVSDNASIDGTEIVCRSYAESDRRVRYIRQSNNLGAAENFKFVLSQARGRYYMWAAGDDLRTSDFLAENVHFLETHPEYVASTCPNCFEGDEKKPELIVSFAIDGDLVARYLQFLRYCWQSHGIFYSLMRTHIIKQCEIPGLSFTAADWAIDFFLISRGRIHRTTKGLAIFGRDGISSSNGAWRAFRNQPIEFFLPFFRFSRYALKLMRPLPWHAWLKLFWELVRLNMKASSDQAIAELYGFYCRYFKSVKY